MLRVLNIIPSHKLNKMVIQVPQKQFLFVHILESARMFCNSVAPLTEYYLELF
jgi:hypothetical protein